MTTEAKPADDAAAAAAAAVAAETEAAAAAANPAENQPAQSAAEIAAEEAAKAKPLADPALAKLDESFLKDGKPDLEKIAETLKRAHTDLPEEGKDYDVAFPKDFDLKGADGEVVKIDEADPVVAQFKEVAKANGIGQKAVSDLMGVYGNIIKAAQGINAEAAKASQDAEFAKLDADRPKAEQRAQSAIRGFAQLFGDKSDLAGSITSSITTAEQVLAIEALIEKINGAPNGKPKPGARSGKSLAEILYG